jgi:hypothetical protein
MPFVPPLVVFPLGRCCRWGIARVEPTGLYRKDGGIMQFLEVIAFTLKSFPHRHLD